MELPDLGDLGCFVIGGLILLVLLLAAVCVIGLLFVGAAITGEEAAGHLERLIAGSTGVHAIAN